MSQIRPVAVVTGGASGVGAATVSALASNGVAVIAVDRHWGDTPFADKAIWRVDGDITSAETWDEVLAAAGQLGDAPAMLVLSAARLEVGDLLTVDDHRFRAVFEVNLFAAALALRKCIPAMIERGGGSIVAVASTDALFAEQGLVAYCASKGALVQLIRCVAVDFAGDGIRANCVCPGAINTPFFRKHVDAAPQPERFLAQKIARHPSARILEASDVAATVCFLLNDSAIGLNGSVVTVDGGLTATFDYDPTATI